ncbi:unnamed protein product [Thelazia callipaeda]|uniref:G_PROTEIN_RECEP_F1_2 domain-containing protein n=1 Tax=Thelazia callipaeda TaxID=103827 RepID=A0A0N5DA88_THECL|nr:unnamed protein product [Thelazia callipaeda]
MNMVETIFCVGLPSCIILLSNLFVIIRLRSYLKQIPSSPTVSFNTASLVVHSESAPVKSCKKTSLARLAQSLSINDKPIRKRQHKSLRYADLRLTRSLLVVTWIFVALNLPNYAYRMVIQFTSLDLQTPAMRRISLLVHTLLYTHHAFLFYFYIFNSPQMKKRLLPTALKLLECYCFKTLENGSY